MRRGEHRCTGATCLRHRREQFGESQGRARRLRCRCLSGCPGGRRRDSRSKRSIAHQLRPQCYDDRETREDSDVDPHASQYRPVGVLDLLDEHRWLWPGGVKPHTTIATAGCTGVQDGSATRWTVGRRYSLANAHWSLRSHARAQSAIVASCRMRSELRRRPAAARA